MSGIAGFINLDGRPANENIARAMLDAIRHRGAEVVRINENEPSLKTEKFFNKTGDGKLILRQVLGDIVPPQIAQAVKRGFSAPDASWFKGESLEYVESIVNSPKARIYDYMDKKTVRPLVAEHTSGQKNSRLFIWSILMFENWLTQYLP